MSGTAFFLLALKAWGEGLVADAMRSTFVARFLALGIENLQRAI